MKKYEMIYQKYRNDILNGFLKNKQQLPSIRESCKLFKTSQTTIQHAYDLLLIEGYIINKPQIGYFVNIDKERIQLHKQIDHYQNKHQTISYQYDFRSQTVSQDSFEVTLWKRYLKDVFNDKMSMSTYGDSQGEYVLREALCQYAYKARGVLCHPNQILVGSNYQALLFILCGLFPHHVTIGMEYQENSQALRVFQSYGYHVEIIQSQDEGIDMIDLRKHSIDILYLNSASQGKKNKPVSLKLSHELLDYTKENNIYIIEDDYNGELTYSSKERFALQGMSNHDHVIYCGSFSRLLLPSLRISYLVLNHHFYDIYKNIKHQYGPTASKLEQLAFAQYISDGYLWKHVKKLKKEYKEKNQQMKKALSQFISYPYDLDEAYLCYHIYLNHIDEERFMKKCQNENIAMNDIQHHILSLSFASLPIHEIYQAIQIISNLLKECEKKEVP